MLLWHPWWCLYWTENPCPWCPEAGGPKGLEKLDWSCPPGPWKGVGPKTGDATDPWWQPWDTDEGPTHCGWFIGCAPIALGCMPWKGEPGVQGCCPGRAPWGGWGDHVGCHIAQMVPGVIGSNNHRIDKMSVTTKISKIKSLWNICIIMNKCKFDWKARGPATFGLDSWRLSI